MARSLSNAKLFSAFVADGISNAVYRRGYAAASQGALMSSVARGTGPTRSAAMMKKSAGEEGSTEKVSWAPDPVTGVYRPENLADELDVADLRAIFLKQKQ